MIRIIISYLILTFLCTMSICAQKGFERDIKSGLFVPKGTWLGGCTFSYSEREGDNYKFLVLKKVEGEAYTFDVSPFAGYFFADNMAAGLRVKYSRTYADIGNIDINLGDDLSFEIKDSKYKEHMFSAAGFLRTYMELGDGRVFGFFNELRVAYSYGQGKDSDGLGNDLVGRYQTINRLQIGSAPGLTAFVTNNAAVEVSIGLVGLDFKWVDQKENQVYSGHYRKSSANFKIDIFSINIGMSFYI